jgi:hypothetical protein
MSIFYRRENYREALFLSEIGFKKKVHSIYSIISKTATDEDFVNAFKTYLPYEWHRVTQYCADKRDDYYRRNKKGLRTVPTYKPEQFIIRKKCKRKKSYAISINDKVELAQTLLCESTERMTKFHAQLKQNMVYIQEVCPPYIKDLIRTYYTTRKHAPLEINARYLILLEASQFRCRETIRFLHQVNSCDKNDDLRQMAFFALQRIGEHPWLARKRKGKKKLTHLRHIDIQKNPTALLELVSRCQYLIYQTFDVFLSHSSKDVDLLLELKQKLNRQNLTVYIDWVNDKEMLNRENQDVNTWNALYLRMNQSKRMLYVVTDNSILSDSTKREVEYFKKQGKHVYVYQPQSITLPMPSYLDDCSKCPLQDEKLIFE